MAIGGCLFVPTLVVMGSKEKVSAGQGGARPVVYDSYGRLSRVPETGDWRRSKLACRQPKASTDGRRDRRGAVRRLVSMETRVRRRLDGFLSG